MGKSSNTWKVTLPESDGAVSPSAIVLLLGWWGAQPKHLAKYAAVHRQVTPGVMTVAGTLESRIIITMNETELRRHAQEGLDTLAALFDTARNDTTQSPVPVMVHIFSNGGAIVWQCMMELLDEQEEDRAQIGNLTEATPLHTNNRNAWIRNRICAQIFDSSPGYPTLSTALAALEGSGIASKGGILLLWLAKAILLLYFALEKSICWVRREPTRLVKFWNDLSTSKWRAPQGFIYSRADKAIDPDYLEDFIRSRQQRSDYISVLKFEESPHVQHYKCHPEQYQTFLKKFLDESLQLYNARFGKGTGPSHRRHKSSRQ